MSCVQPLLPTLLTACACDALGRYVLLQGATIRTDNGKVFLARLLAGSTLAESGKLFLRIMLQATMQIGLILAVGDPFQVWYILVKTLFDQYISLSRLCGAGYALGMNCWLFSCRDLQQVPRTVINL